MAGRSERVPTPGAEVTASGLLSIALHLAGVEWLSLILLGIAAGLWVWRAFTLAARWDPRGAFTAAVQTGVVGTAVLGVRLVMLDWLISAALLLAVAAVLWIPLLTLGLGPTPLRRTRPEVAYLACVATQAVVVIAAVLGLARGTPWVLWPGLVVFAFGLALYAWTLLRFDVASLRTGAGQHWVVAAATALSALAGARLTAVAAGAEWVGTWGAAAAHLVLASVTWALVTLALAWCLVLVASEIRWPRPRYSPHRWTTVFALAATTVSCMVAGAVLGFPILSVVGVVFALPTLALWLAVTVGTVAHAIHPAAAPHPKPAPLGTPGG